MTSSPLKIGIVGCAGRMGRMLIQEILATPGCMLAGGTEPAGPAVGSDLGLLVGPKPVGVSVMADAEKLFAVSDTVIDFTVPAATLWHTRLAAKTGKTLIVGTTGLDESILGALAEAGKTAAVVHAPNFSLGVNVMFAVTEKIAATLGPDYDIDILEMHHRHKVDAPSGTALGLGEAAAKGRNVKLANVWRKSRDGQVGPRPTGEIGFATLRGGDVVGDHTVMFAAEGERIELTHRASSRAVFAKGAVRAALWARGRGPGLYSMRDVLGL
ncbi:MAG: 4-hydroxy-tetrahydrodipicolinate reductase [Rhodospirillaceae bacterium]|nr:4-hydroxy-tetrahydrodipicolinate reductase [Rhodospirillaceae bacterium]